MDDTVVSTISVPHSLPRSGASRAGVAAYRGRRPMLPRGAYLLAGLDSLAAVTAIVAVLIRANVATLSGIDDFLSVRITVKNILLLVFLASAWPAVFRLFGLYEARRLRQIRSEFGRLLAASILGCGLALVFPLTSVSGSFQLAQLQDFWLTSLALGLLVRTGRRAVVRTPPVPRVLIVGTGRLARGVYLDLRTDGPHPCELVGFVDEPINGGPPFERVRDQTIGTLEQLEELLMRQVIDEVIIALPIKSCYHQIQHAIGVCERAGVQAKYGAEVFESAVAFPCLDPDGQRAFVALRVAPDGYQLVVKRVIDIVGAAAALVVLSPLMALVAIAIKIGSPGPVIYAQSRCGLAKRPFRMFKFRSMFVDADKLQASLEPWNEAQGPVFKIRNDPRITPLGRVLRKSSIDELPQLWNVLRGDMSLVGPRPLAWRDVNRIERPSDMRRFSMPPGITCLWQVQGRSNLDFDRWVQLDLEYIERWSLALDLRILVETIPAVLSGNGAS